MDATLVAQLDIPGMRPAKQKRSRDLVAELMRAGLALLKDRDFDRLSIADLCAATNITVGSFYARFDGKEAYIRALQSGVVEEARRAMRRDYRADIAWPRGLAGFIEWIVGTSVAWNRRYEGLVRASLRQAGRDPAAWTPLRELGQERVALALPIALSLLGRPPVVGDEDAIRFAFQILSGTVNNMILINPGPFSIHDEATPRMLSRAMLKLIEG
ncbi:MAG: TetR/AcrR family transcriptional regulator [Alphaproteobacteria bacterium]|nr:TetR/AcrR family transcriptional regulator [Alphaproteobacteria bacterium]